jgi:motility quorum-sensing regulator/GCU-specific mRNA interferase toxin
VTEKRKPTYELKAFKKACDDPQELNVTVTARKDAFDLGFNEQGMVDVIQTMERSHFYKSMTSYADYKIWQDVYHVPSKAGLLYVKFTADVVTEFLLLSFKEK